nr:hypothetical protein [uncultured Psychroserpens sp.]
MFRHFKKKVVHFLNSKKDYAFLAGASGGLYALFYLYDTNFTLLDSWIQLLFLITTFCVLPGFVLYGINKIVKKIKSFKNYHKYFIPVMNFMFLAFFVIAATHGIQKKKILFGSLVIAFILGILLYKHIKKVIILQLVLSCFLLIKLTPKVYEMLNYSFDWQIQPDKILETKFVKRPNIYVLQPDGYVGFNKIKEDYYNHNNDVMKSFLEDNRFKIYNAFRSNYTNTLSSNSSMFSMKHHYYGSAQGHNELYNARTIIAGKNPVLDILENNNYRTNLILDAPYFLVNRPKLDYDYCNVSYKDIPYLAKGFDYKTNIKEDLFKAIEANKEFNNFYFIRHADPGHISTNASKGKEVERQGYIEKLEVSNAWLKSVLSELEKKDPNAIVIVSSDHGGYVGFDYTKQHQTKVTDKSLVHSMFSSVLAIKWLDNDIPNYDTELKTSVNLFRIVFSYLSDNPDYLNHLEEDKSYSIIKEGAPYGIYELVDEKDNVVFDKVN